MHDRGGKSAQLIRHKSSSVANKTLIFLPGFDGVGDYSISTIYKLSPQYDIWRLEVEASDRSSFLELSDMIVSHIDSLNSPVVLFGESFGGLLACHIASRLGDKVSQLVLANPATSYEDSNWPTMGPLLTRTGPLFPIAGLAALGITGVEVSQVQR